MPFAHVQVELSAANGIAENNVVNTFSFITGATVATDAEVCADAAERFYNAIDTPTNALPLAAYIGGSISRAANDHQIRVYDVTDDLFGTPHGSPVFARPFTFDGGAVTSALPAEIALVLTLRGTGYESAAVEASDGTDADALPDRPRQRHSGRVYVGPLIREVSEVVDGVARPTAAFRQRALDSIEAMCFGANAFGVRLATWSRKDGVMRSVTAASVDNAFDTMRTRGEDATLKESITGLQA